MRSLTLLADESKSPFSALFGTLASALEKVLDGAYPGQLQLISEAEAVLRRAVALHPDPRGALVTHLALVLEKESSEEAHKLYRKTLMQHPNNPNPFTLLSLGHFLSKDPERQSEAKQFLQRWVAVTKHTPLSLQRFESDTQYCWIFQLYLKYLK